MAEERFGTGVTNQGNDDLDNHIDTESEIHPGFNGSRVNVVPDYSNTDLQQRPLDYVSQQVWNHQQLHDGAMNDTHTTIMRAPSFTSVSNQQRWEDIDCASKKSEGIVEVSLTDPQFFDDHLESQPCTTSTSLKWRGVEWNVLIRRGDIDTYCYYVGFDTDKVPFDFDLKVQCTVSLLGDESDTPIKIGDTHPHRFYYVNEERCDIGDPTLLSSEWGQVKERYESHCVLQQANNSEPFKIRLSVKLRTPFTPMKQENRYNSKISTGMVGITNLGATCYLNALLQMLYHVPGFRRTVFAMPHETEKYGSSTTLGLQEVFHNLLTYQRAINTKYLLKAFGWNDTDAFMQQDVQEMMRVLLDKIEESAKETSVDGRIKDMFCGSVRSFISCTNVKYDSKREEDFYDIQLDVKGCKTMLESFNKYTESEMLEGENQYDAGPELGKQDAEKGVIFTKLPPVLTIHLKRFDFDFQRMGYKKIHDHFKFPVWTNLDYFVASDVPEDCRIDNDYILHSVLVHAGDFGGGHYYAYIRPSCDANRDFEYIKQAKIMKSKAASAVAEYESSKTARINGNTEKQLQDELDDIGRGGQWFKFDDDVVLAVDDEEAVDYCFGRDESSINQGMSSAYMLLYIRANSLEDVMTPFDESNSADIPKSLMHRLIAEARVKKLRSRSLKENKTCFGDIRYFTEASLESYRPFREITKKQIILDLEDAQNFQVRNDSSCLRVLIESADTLDLSPSKINIYKCPYSNLPVLSETKMRRITALLDHQSLSQKASVFFPNKISFVFIEIAKPEDVHKHKRDNDLFEKQYKKIREREKGWLQSLRNSLLGSCSASEDNQHCIALTESRTIIEDLIRGYGIGSSDSEGWKSTVELVLQPDSAEGIVSILQKDLAKIEQDMMQLLQSYKKPFPNNQMIIMKVFDPTGQFDAVIDACKAASYWADANTKYDECQVIESARDKKAKFFKFLCLTRCDLSVGEEPSHDSLFDTSSESSKDILRDILDQSMKELPGMSPELLLSMSRWKLYLGCHDLETENYLVENHTVEDLKECPVVIIDPCFESHSYIILSDTVSKTYPEVNRSWTAYCAYILNYEIFPCQVLQDGFSHYALSPSEAANTVVIKNSSQVGQKRAISEKDDAASSVSNNTHEFDVEIVSESDATFSDVAIFIGNHINVDAKHLLLWVCQDITPENFKFDLYLNNHLLKCHAGTDSRCSARNLIMYSVSPYPVIGHASEIIEDVLRPCILITDGRLRLWRKLFVSFLRKRIASVENIKRQKTQSVSASGDGNDRAYFQFSLDADELYKISGGTAFLTEAGQSITLQYSQSFVNTICSLQVTVRELHLLEDYVFVRFPSECQSKVHSIMSQLQHTLGIPANANLIMPHITWVSQCEFDERARFQATIKDPHVDGPLTRASIELDDIHRTAYKYVHDHAVRSTSSIIHLFSDSLLEDDADDRAMDDEEVSEAVDENIEYFEKTTSKIFRTLESEEFLKQKEHLVLLDIHDNEIHGVFANDANTGGLDCWPDAATQKVNWPNTWSYAVQSMLTLDMQFVRNTSPLCRSMVVQVLPFHDPNTYFKAAQIGTFPGHFLLYLREDDSFESLSLRVSIAMGLEFVSDLDLYMVPPGRSFRRQAKKLVNPQLRSETHHVDIGLAMDDANEKTHEPLSHLGSVEQGKSGDAQEQRFNDGSDDQVESVWKVFADSFPNFAEYEYERALLKTVEYQNVGNVEGKSPFPILAVLFDNSEEATDEGKSDVDGDNSRRPRSSSISSNSSTSMRRRKSSQIMIN